MTLEWLLIVGAIAGLAATSVLVVQRVLDDTAEIPADPAVRVIDADVAAAFVAADAQAAFDSDPPNYYNVNEKFEHRCDDVRTAFSDVVDVDVDGWAPAQGGDTPDDLTDDVPAKCVLTLHSNLGG